MTRRAFQPRSPDARGAWSDPTTRDGSLEDVAATLAPRSGETEISTITNRYGHDVVDAMQGEVLVDLAQTDPADVGCVVDLGQGDVTAAGESATGHRSPDRIGAGHLSPSWPSVLRVTNAFGTTDLIDARPRARP